VDECYQVAAAMARASHPEATAAFLACMDKVLAKKSHYYTCGMLGLIPELPKTAIPKIEALVPKLPERLADSVVGYLQQLRDKK
jgi:hypothetical protein